MMHTSDHSSFHPGLQQFLYGRECLPEELPFPDEVIRKQIQEGWITLRPGIETADALPFPFSFVKKNICRRCGNTDPDAFGTHLCGRCGHFCVYCRRCLNMGAIRSCTRLLTWNGPAPAAQVPHVNKSGRLCVWKGTLSPRQAAASGQLRRSLAEGRSFLIWAVTGSGKTELIFPAVEDRLLQGKRIAIASPRTDVVRELAPRIRAAFPEVPVGVFYGGSHEKWFHAPLLITTTHQLLRFYRCFDCVFIDEVDAFPFHADPVLTFAVHKAAKEQAPFAFLTATPPAGLKRAFLSGKLRGVKIAGRYHGHPLPVPRFQWIGNWKKSMAQKQIPEPFYRWLRQKAAPETRLFVFVSSVKLARQLAGLLQKKGMERVAGVHADDPERHEKVAFFREGKLRILVTTTILERGVTVPGVEVAVFGADDPVFDERALVQISGRAGRSPEHPGGDVLFFHDGKTIEMIRARRHIEQMNKEAGF